MTDRLYGLPIVAALALCVAAAPGLAQQAPDHPSVTVNGKTYTPRSILARNMGGEADPYTPFGPYRVIGNIYYVGTNTLTSFLITTPEGHFIVNSTFERNLPVIEKSAAQLGFKLADVKIVLGTHAHGDHQEGDALLKEKTGAQVMAMAEDVPLLEAMTPGGKPHPIDRVLHDGDQVTLGGTTLTAHLTGGHTPGCTTWTATAQEAGKTYNVMIGCSLRPPMVPTPQVVETFRRTFKTVRALPCDVQLGDHGAQYGMQEKYAKMKEGSPNPFIEPATCAQEADLGEAMLNALIAEQQPVR